MEQHKRTFEVLRDHQADRPSAPSSHRSWTPLSARARRGDPGVTFDYPDGVEPPDHHDEDVRGIERHAVCQPAFGTWLPSSHPGPLDLLLVARARQARIFNPHHLDARARPGQGWDVASPTHSLDAWCFNLGRAADGTALRWSVPVQDVVDSRAIPRHEVFRELLPDFYRLTSNGTPDTQIGAPSAPLELHRDQREAFASPDPDMTGLFFGTGGTRNVLIDVTKLATRLLYGTAEFFDRTPMDRMRNCHWSGRAVRDLLGDASRAKKRAIIYVSSPSWEVRRGPVPASGFEGASGNRLRSYQRPHVVDYSSNTSVDICGVSVPGYRFLADGSVLYRSQGYDCGHGGRGWCEPGGEPQARANNLIRRIDLCPSSGLMSAARMADYWFWAARTSLQRSRTLRGSLGRDMRGFASRCARLAASYIVEFTKTLVHELGHMNELCGSNHCCTGPGDDGDCLSTKTTNYDCGHDLPKMLWAAYLRTLLRLPPAWPATSRITARVVPGSGVLYPAGTRSFDYGLPRRTAFLDGPFSRESYSIMQGTVGKHCGCTDHTVRGEAANHDAAPSLINMLPADALCGFWTETHLESGSRRRCVVQWSISPFCSSGADISVGHLLFDPGRR